MALLLTWLPVGFDGVDSAGTVPSALWRETGNEGPDTLELDPMGAISEASFEVECRAAERGAASLMADDILHQLTRDNALIAMQSRHDESDDVSQKLGKYFSHIIVFAISNSGLRIV